MVATALASTAVALAATELVGRLWLVHLAGITERPPDPSMISAAFEPFLMMGFQYGWFEDSDREEMEKAEGPSAFGYRSSGGVYLYDFDEPIAGIADRGKFLFEGDGLANNPTAQPLRVFVVGASVAQGIGSSSHDTTWHVVLERSLSKALGREVHLVVGAVPGYVSTQERLVLDLMVLPRCPDAVVILNGWDDAALPAMLGSRPGDPITQGLLYERFFPSSFELTGFLMRHSAMYRYFYHQRVLAGLEQHRASIANDRGRLQRYRESIASVYLDNLGRMLESCRQHSIPCAAFLQPARALTSQKAPPGWATQAGLERAAYEEIRARLGAMQSRYRVHDLTTIFPPGSDWFIDQVHFGDQGHAVIAQSIEPDLIEMLRDNHRQGGSTNCNG